MTSDIFLKQDGIEAVTTNEKSLAVTTGEEKDPDIRLIPNTATLRLGGGDGEYSDGDIRLMDRPDNGESKTRVHLTGGTGATSSDTRIRMDGSDGTAKLGAQSADDPDVELRPGDGLLRLGGGAGKEDEEHRSFGSIRLEEGTADPRVFISADGEEPSDPVQSAVFVTGGSGDTEVIPGESGNSGEIRLKRVGDHFDDSTVILNGRTGQLSLGSNIQSGDLRMYKETVPAIPTIRLHAADAHAVVGGSNEGTEGAAGTVHLEDSTGTATVRVDAHTDLARGGAIAVSTAEGTETVSVLSNHAPANGGAIRVANADGDARVALESNPKDANGGVVRLSNEAHAETATLDSGPKSDEGGQLTLRGVGGSSRISLRGTGGTSDGGAMFLSDGSAFPTVRLDGGDGRVTLGGTEQSDPTGVGSRENGTLSLDDGEGMVVDLEAESGSVILAHHDATKGEIGLELRPEDGVFNVFDGSGDPVFQIDTQAKTIKKAKGYKEGVIGRGP